MTVRAGDIKQLVLMGSERDPKSGSTFEIVLGGYNVEEGVTGNGKVDNTANRKIGHISGTVSRPPQTKLLTELQGKMDAFEEDTCSITLVDGSVYGGQLSLTGELSQSSDGGSIDFVASGNVMEQ